MNTSRKCPFFVACIVMAIMVGGLPYWSGTCAKWTGLCSVRAEETDRSGFWHTEGANIVDENGDVVQLRGMGLLGTWWYQGDRYDTTPVWYHSRESYRELKELGFNSVRLLQVDI